MNQLNILKILLSLSLLVNLWFLWHRPREIVYERDQRILDENFKKEQQIIKLEHERDSLKAARTTIIEKEKIRYIRYKENEKVIGNISDVHAADSMLRAIW